MEKSTEVLIEMAGVLYNNWLCRFKAFREFVTLWANLCRNLKELSEQVDELRTSNESLRKEIEDLKATPKYSKQGLQDPKLSASSLMDNFYEAYYTTDTK